MLRAEPPEPAPFVVLAELQTAGVGQWQAPWDSPEGGFWGTFVMALPSAAAADGLGLRVGLAVTEAIHDLIGTDHVRLKWPNDVLVAGQKLAGILTETVAIGPDQTVALIGIGINANMDVGSLEASLRSRSTTLRAVLGRETDLESLRRELWVGLTQAVGMIGIPPKVLARAESMLHGLHEPVELRISGSHVRGILQGLDAQGRPVLLTEATP